MKPLLLILSLTIVASVPSFSTIIRVNNDTEVEADYTTIQDAHDAATAGDTIYVEPSASDYAGFTCSKQLVIIGGGWDLSENYPDNYKSSNDTRVFGQNNFNSGSEGSIVIGIFFDFSNTNYAALHVYAEGVEISRCQIANQSTSRNGIHISANNTVLSQNYLHGITIDANITGTLIRNNFIVSGGNSVTIPSTSVATWINNIFSLTITMNEQVMSNNINLSSGLTLVNCSLSNNIDAQLSSEIFGTTNGNFGDVAPDDIFSPSETGLRYYELNSTSAALGAGVSGEDCGMYGGDYPFKLSGLPPIPLVTDFFQSGAGSNTSPIQVRVSVESNN